MENKTYASLLTIEETNPIWTNIEFRNYIETMIARYLGLDLKTKEECIVWFTNKEGHKVLFVDESIIVENLAEVNAFIIGILNGMSLSEQVAKEKNNGKGSSD